MKTRKNDRVVMVIDKGWIVCGNRTVDSTGSRIYLSQCTWVFGWQSVGFHGVLFDPKGGQITLYPFPDIEIPSVSEVYSVPVDDDWGMHVR